jgi:hypothetical protein
VPAFRVSHKQNNTPSWQGQVLAVAHALLSPPGRLDAFWTIEESLYVDSAIVTAVTYRAVLRGYLLEEALAWLLRNSGYRLLVDKSQDPEELDTKGGTLVVQGRGAAHQVDVLGEFALTPAFSLPIRMFLEAKFNRGPCDLAIVRNAHGVIHDINENFVHVGGLRPRRRYHYVYSLFSARGFTGPAQDYALAQQISLVDLSGASFDWLRDNISEAAAQLYERRNQHHITRFPVSWMRQVLRVSLGTFTLEEPMLVQSDDLAAGAVTNAPRFRQAAQRIIEAFATALRASESGELLLGFPAAPFILPLGAENPMQFVEYAESRPTHPVRLRRIGSGDRAEWILSPWDEMDAYRLTFNLPERIESWISANEERRRMRASIIKSGFLSEITVYRRADDGMRIYQLRYEPSELHRPQP